MDLGPNRLVVVTCLCLTSIMTNKIKVWKDRIISRMVRVEPLPETVIREFVESLHVPYNALSGREKQLLANVQNLTMWAEIVALSGRHAGSLPPPISPGSFGKVAGRNWQGEMCPGMMSPACSKL